MGVSSRGCCGVVVSAAVFCIVQSLIWLVLSVIALLLRSCSFLPDIENAPYILIIVYFYNEDCAPEWVSDQIKETPAPTKRTDIITWYFLVTSVLRVAASVALLVALAAARRRGRGVGGVAVFFLVWFVLVVACLCGDLACAIVYGMDLRNVKTLSDLLGQNVEEVGASSAYWGLSAVPLVMFFFCIRWGILWIPEAIMTGISAKVYWKDRKEMKWLYAGNSSNTLASSSNSSVQVPWMMEDHDDDARGNGVVGRTGGGGSGGGGGGGNGADFVRNPSPTEYQNPSPIMTQDAPYSVPADSTQGWGGAYPRDPNRRTGSDVGGLRRAHVPPPLHLSPEMSGPPSPNRLGPWDPRSPMPPPGQSQQQPFFNNPAPSAFRTPPPSMEPPPPPSSSSELGPDGERRYKLKLKDHDAELRRREEDRAAQEMERRRMHQQLLEDQERRYRDMALQEVAQKAEERRRRRAEVEVEAAARKARVRPVPPPKPPTRAATTGLQHEKPWSYVLPPRDDMPAPRGAGAGAYDDEDAPPVPVPDYTLHFKRSGDRPSIGQN